MSVIGMVIGAGRYAIGIAATVIILIIQIVFHINNELIPIMITDVSVTYFFCCEMSKNTNEEKPVRMFSYRCKVDFTHWWFAL